MKQKLK